MSTGICRWLFLLVSFSTWTQYTYSKEIRVVCYYTNWSVYRPGTAKFSPQNINPYLCTHLIYAFGGFTKENTLKPFDKYQDIEKGGYAKFTGLKTYNKNLKTLLAIGGWNEASSRFSPMAANAERRKELVKNAIKFLRQNHFDGLDLDWEYPSFREGGKPRDKDNYAKLVQELREEFERESEKTGRPRLLLTMAVPAGIEYINKGYDVPKLTKYLDWMNILSYDYHSAFEPAVNHHAPLFSLEEASEYNYDTELNIDYTIKHYLELGADPNKLVLGIPTYGRSYTLFNPDANEIGSPADGPGDMGDATRENGYLAYYEICDNIKSNDWTIVQPNDNAMGPYAYKENQWVGFDDESIARKKSKYVAENNLGGIMFWAIDNDDFRGTCHGRPYPLIEAAKEALIEAYGLTDDNLISPPSKPTKLKPRTRTRPKSSEHVEAKSTSSNLNRRRNRNKTKVKDESTQINTRSSPRRKESPRRIENTSTYSSLKVITPSYTTPAPPATPDQGGAFKCEDEGFFPHPKDCKKYFWCLSGPGELGIIAHQFTCPAGLYFNKGADSCDYTQNVLCNKKLSKPKTTTESSSDAVSSTTKKATTTAFTFPTSRSPPKITAATSRTTFRQTTTTEASYDEEYEYEDDDTGGGGKVDSEEDPKVIKELLDLIKKAGGIEELEKHLNIHDSGSPNVGFTTPSTRTKSIVEKFLSKTSRNSVSSNRKPYSTINRNSRGPQNEGLSTETEPRSKNKVERGKPSYTNILRQRAVSPKTADEEESDDEEETDPPKTSKKSNQPEYVNIRRNRFGGSSTTEEPVSNTKTYDRNKILGESDDEEEDKNISNKVTLLRHTTPQYVNIRRSRPTTEESPSTKYATMRREPTTEVTPEDSDSDNDLTTPRYITLRRSSTTEPTTTNNYSGTTLRYATVSTETTVKTADVTFPSRETSTRNNMSAGTKEPSLSEAITAIPVEEPTVIPKITASPYLSILNSDNTNNIRTSTLLDTTVVDSFSLSTTRTTEITTETQTTTPIERVRTSPLLLEPRPFSISPREPLLTTSKPFRRTTTQTAKVSESNKRLRNKVNDSEPVYYPRKIIYSRREDNKSSTNDVPQRNRGSSRFSDKFDHSNDINNSNTSFVRGRKRISTDKPLLSDENVEAESPSSKNNVNRKAFVGGTRRFRPRPTPSQQTPSPEVTDDKSSRPYTRFISRKRPNQFGNNPTRNTGLKDQINSNSDDVTRATDSLEPKEFSRATPRNRKVIRRFRSTTPTITFSESTRNYNRRGGYFTHTTLANEINDLFVDNLPDQDNNLEDTSNEEDENIKLSESNIRENSNVNNNNAIFDVKGSQKFNRNEHKLLGKSARTLNNKPTEPNVIVRTRKIIRKIRPTEKYVISSTTVTEATNVGSQNEDDSQIEVTRVNNTSTTESTHHGRTRKIIRRLRPTTSSSSSRFGTTVTISPTVPTDDSFRHTPNLSNYKETKDIRSSTPNSVNQSRIRNRFKSDSLTNKYSPNLFTIEHQEAKNVQENDEAGVQTVSPITLKPRNRFIIRHRATTPKPIEETEEPTTEEIRPSVTSRGTVKYFTNFETTTHSEVSDDLQSTIPQTEDNSITETFNEPVTTDDQTSEGVTITIPFTETESKPQITESVTDYSLITSKLADEENGQSTIPFVVTTEETTSIDTTEEEFVSTERSSTNEVTTSTTVGSVGSTEENSTEPAITGSIETTTLSHRRSTLRSFRTRPPYSGLKRLTVTEIPSSTVGQIDLQQKTTNKRRRIYRPSSTTEKTNPPSNSRFRNPTAIKNRHLYRSSSTTEKTKYSTPEDDENEDDVSLVVADTEVETVTKHSKFRPASRFNKGFGPTKSNNTRKASSRTKIFGRTTEANRPVEDLNGINKAAVLSRNKNLFSKKRKMNIPTYNAPHELFNEENSFTSSASTTLDTESSTEYLTTLNHVFAETESPLKSSTVANEKIQKNPGKQERIVEVNRIVEVHVKNEVSSEEPHPSLDKIGAINRVTVIKIVDGNATNDTEKDIAENEIGYEAVPTTIIQQHENKSQIVANQKEFDIPFMVPGLATIQEIIMNEKNFSTDNQTDSVRQDRKFEIYGESKVNRNKLPDVVREINFDGEADVIDGFSHIKIITPKPVYPTEASTIALEGLFTTEPSRNGDKITTESELLDTEHSRFVDIRVLKQDNVGRKFAGRSDHDDFVPIRVLPNEEGVALRARVVEVAPKDKDGIRIVPIQVAMARKIGDIPIVGLANLNDKISNTPFNTQLESGVS